MSDLTHWLKYAMNVITEAFKADALSVVARELAVINYQYLRRLLLQRVCVIGKGSGWVSKDSESRQCQN
jgi:hypothetical protein